MRHMYIDGRRHSKSLLRGAGMGSVLLNQGGTGSASAYRSIPEYEQTTGVRIKGLGFGDRGGLSDKLQALVVKSKEIGKERKKRKNIQF